VRRYTPASLGMLGTLSTCLAIDVYGPICDNAGGATPVHLNPTLICLPNLRPDGGKRLRVAVGHHSE